MFLIDKKNILPTSDLQHIIEQSEHKCIKTADNPFYGLPPSFYKSDRRDSNLFQSPKANKIKEGCTLSTGCLQCV